LEIKYLTLSAFFPQEDCSISGLQAWKGPLINHLCMQTCRLPEFRVVHEASTGLELRVVCLQIDVQFSFFLFKVLF
jgi:hypothetical protein